MIKFNIYKRGNTWTYVVEGPKENNQRNRITKGGFKRKKDCEAEAIALEHELNSNRSSYKNNKILYEDLANEFLEYHKLSVRETTFKSSVNLLAHSKCYFKSFYIKDIKTLDIQKFITYLIDKNLSNMYIKLIYNKLKQVFNYGNDIVEIINYKPNFSKVVLPKVNSKIREDILTEDDIKIILEKYKDTIFYYIFQVAILTGMRKGEILALTWDKIDFKNNKIIVNKNLNRFETLTLPKNLSSIREIPINNKLKEILIELKDKKQKKLNFILEEDRIILSDIPNLDFIFRDCNGAYIKTSKIHSLFGKAFDNKYHFHQFRHYFATKLINAGIPVPEVSKILGHAKVSTTMNMYVGINNQSDIKNKLDQIFGQQMDNN